MAKKSFLKNLIYPLIVTVVGGLIVVFLQEYLISEKEVAPAPYGQHIIINNYEDGEINIKNVH